MRIIIGHSDDPDGGLAIQDVIEQLAAKLGDAPPAGALLYTCIDIDHQAILDGIQARWPGLPLIGCTTDGECSSVLQFVEDSVVLTLFVGDELDLRVGLGRGVRDDAAAAIDAALAPVLSAGTPSLVIALPESIGVSGATVVQELNRKLPAESVLVGGTAGDQWRFEATLQFFGGEVVRGTVPVLAFGGDLRVSVGIACGWSPLGRRGVITRAEGSILYEIDQAPALDFLHANMGHADPNPEFPFAIYEPGADGFYLRAPMAAGPDGHIVLAGDVPVGAEIQLTEAGRDEILDGARHAAALALDGFEGTPEALLVFSCAARKQVLGTRCAEEIGLLQSALAPSVCTAGFYTYGEIGPLATGERSRFHNETVVAALIGR